MSTFRKIVQIIFSLLAIIALVLSISLLYPIPYLSRFAIEYIFTNEALRIAIVIILGLIAIYAFINLIQAIFARSLQSHLELEKEKGEINISKKAIVSTARASIEDLPEVLDTDIDARLYDDPKDTVVNVIAETNNAADVISLAEVIQARVENAVNRTLGVEVERVNVKIEKIDDEKLKNSTNRKNKSRPRVI